MAEENLNKYLPKIKFAFLLSAFSVLLIYLLYGLFFEDSIKNFGSFLYGSITSPPYEVWFEESFFLQPPIVAFLSHQFQLLPIFGIWFLILQIIIVALWFHLAIRAQMRFIKNSPLTIIFLSLLVVLVILGTSLVYIHLSRVSILLTSVSLLLYFDYFLNDDRKPISFVLLFLLGCLVRVSTGIMALGIVSILISLYYRNLKKVLYLLFPQWILAILCITIVMAYKFTANNIGLQIQQTYEYALEDQHSMVPISSMKTEKDSTRYIALTRYFLIADSAQINIDFLKRIVNGGRHSIFSISKIDFSHLSGILSSLLIKYWLPLILLYFLLLVLMCYCSRQTISNILIFQTIGWLIVVVLTMKISMYERFLLPWLSVLIASSLFLISLDVKFFRLWQKASTFLLLPIIFFLVTSELKNISKQEQGYNRMAYTYLKNIDTLTKSCMPVIWDYNQAYFPSDIFVRGALSVFEHCSYQALFFHAYYKFGQERCIEQFGFSPLNWRTMGIALKKNSNKICFVMDDSFASFLKAYYKTLYNIDFILIKDSPPNEITPDNFVYHLQAN